MFNKRAKRVFEKVNVALKEQESRQKVLNALSFLDEEQSKTHLRSWDAALKDRPKIVTSSPVKQNDSFLTLDVDSIEHVSANDSINNVQDHQVKIHVIEITKDGTNTVIPRKLNLDIDQPLIDAIKNEMSDIFHTDDENNATPASLKLSNGDIIFYHWEPIIGNSDKSIIIFIQSAWQMQRREYGIASRQTPLIHIFTKYAKQIEVEICKVNFLLDGDVVDAMKSPEDLMLDGGEVFDCVPATEKANSSPKTIEHKQPEDSDNSIVILERWPTRKRRRRRRR
ncbi:hypothetical protein ACOME3_008167 [Neoechinorhynchus agilis]